jgi:hypothetical protein
MLAELNGHEVGAGSTRETVVLIGIIPKSKAQILTIFITLRPPDHFIRSSTRKRPLSALLLQVCRPV